MYALELNGEFFVYRRSDAKLILSADKRLARIYETIKGARIASTQYEQGYGMRMMPTKFEIPGSMNGSNRVKTSRKHARAASQAGRRRDSVTVDIGLL